MEMTWTRHVTHNGDVRFDQMWVGISVEKIYLEI
jgi:hypothetical protein